MIIDPEALKVAVVAYDLARRAIHGPNEPAMSERNQETIAPMIAAAIMAYAAARKPNDDRWVMFAEGSPVINVAL